MALDALSNDERIRLKELVEKGIRTTQEIVDLREGLRDTVKAFAEELSIEAKCINEAIKVAFNNSLNDKKDAFDTVAEILHLTGRD